MLQSKEHCQTGFLLLYLWMCKYHAVAKQFVHHSVRQQFLTCNLYNSPFFSL